MQRTMSLETLRLNYAPGNRRPFLRFGGTKIEEDDAYDSLVAGLRRFIDGGYVYSERERAPDADLLEGA